MYKTSFQRVGLAAILLCFTAGAAFADFAGTASGSFSPGGATSVYGLSYQGGTFGPSGSPINLGTFTLDSANTIASLDPYSFTLTVTFTQPQGAGGSFSADVQGVVIFGYGVASINFDPNTQHIKYTNSTGSGSFDLRVDDVLLLDLSGTGSKVVQDVKGYITNATFAPTPEPEAVVLMSTLLGGALFLFKRRTRRA